MPRPTAVLVAALVCVSAAGLTRSARPSETPPVTRTRVVLLGTGTPALDPDRSGPATAVVVGDTAYIVDLGPGIVRRAAAASLDAGFRKGIKALEPTSLRTAFVTHLHS